LAICTGLHVAVPPYAVSLSSKKSPFGDVRKIRKPYS
jgi:hypothetical protein